jgi:hypothetical protein
MRSSLQRKITTSRRLSHRQVALIGSLCAERDDLIARRNKPRGADQWTTCWTSLTRDMLCSWLMMNLQHRDHTETRLIDECKKIPQICRSYRLEECWDNVTLSASNYLFFLNLSHHLVLQAQAFCFRWKWNCRSGSCGKHVVLAFAEKGRTKHWQILYYLITVIFQGRGEIKSSSTWSHGHALCAFQGCWKVCGLAAAARILDVVAKCTSHSSSSKLPMRIFGDLVEVVLYNIKLFSPRW